jgi:hypothetical protein
MADPQEVRVLVHYPEHFWEISPLLRAHVDLVIFDGHGYLPPKVGRLHLGPAWIRTEQGDGIVAPVFVLGACWGATELFIEALRRCLDAPQTAFLGCTDKADLAHARSCSPSSWICSPNSDRTRHQARFTRDFLVSSSQTAVLPPAGALVF